MTARRALLESDDSYSYLLEDAPLSAPARRALCEPEDTVIMPKLTGVDAFAVPVARKATKRNRSLVALGLAAVVGLVPVMVNPASATVAAKAPQVASYVVNDEADIFEAQAASIAAAKAEEERKAKEAAEKAAEEARAQAEAEERAAEEARQAEAAQEREAAAAASISRNTERTAPAAATASEPIYTAPPASGAGAGALAYAMAQIGKPYIYGAAGPDGFDCSGLVSAAYASVGISITRSSYGQAYVGSPIYSVADLQPGDIVITYGGDHAALYVGDGIVVHASMPGVPIQTIPLSYLGAITAMRRLG